MPYITFDLLICLFFFLFFVSIMRHGVSVTIGFTGVTMNAFTRFQTENVHKRLF